MLNRHKVSYEKIISMQLIKQNLTICLLCKRLVSCLLFVLLLVIMAGCTEDAPEFVAPQISITSFMPKSANTCLLTVNVKKGAGAKLKRLAFELEDITDITQQSTTIEFSIQKNTEYSDTFLIKVPIAFHDYAVRAVLHSEKNTYRSAPNLICFSKNIINSSEGIKNIAIDENYSTQIYNYEDIGVILNKDKDFYFTVNYYRIPTAKSIYQLKLNGTIPLNLITKFEGSEYNSGLSWKSHIPADLPEGTYSLHLYVDGKEYISTTKLQVLTGTGTQYTLSSPGYYVESTYSGKQNASFILGDKLFITLSNAAHTVLAYDMKNKWWETKKSVNYSDAYRSYSYFEAKNVSYKNQQYLTEYLYNYTEMKLTGINIVAYNENLDSWAKITTYPGVGTENFIQFVIGDCLYMGGGYGSTSNLLKYDFWQYNFITDTWTQKNNLPADINGRIIGSCSSPSEGYIITIFREFWNYLPEQDKWTNKTTLNIGPYVRSSTQLIYGNERIYLFGGSPSSSNDPLLYDVCEYNPSTGKWKLIYLSSMYIGNTNSYFYKNKLLIGIRNSSELFIEEIKP